jgi:hypothetical protein
MGERADPVVIVTVAVFIRTVNGAFSSIINQPLL